MPRALKAAFAKKKAAGKEVKVAMTFPGGTHDLWIRYWLAAGGIDPDKDVSTIVVPPPQMVANMKVGNMDAFCVGEPWNEQLVNQDIGFTALHHRRDLVQASREGRSACAPTGSTRIRRPRRRILMAVMEAQQWCDKMENKQEMAEIVGRRQWFNVPVPDIIGRIKGDINYGHGRVAKGTNLLMKFWGEKRRGLLSLEEPRHLVRHREHPLGQVRARRPTSRRWSTRSTAPTSGARPPRALGVADAPDRRQPRRRDLLRRQGLRSGQPDGLPRSPSSIKRADV